MEEKTTPRFLVRNRESDGQTVIEVRFDDTTNEIPVVVYSEEDHEKIILARQSLGTNQVTESKSKQAWKALRMFW